MNGEALKERAIDAYVGALTALDPVRLRFWDSRGLTMSQLRLMYLVRQWGTPSVGALSAEMRVRLPTLTGLVKRLLQRHLVERYHDEADRRVVRLRLSAEGVRILDEITVAGRAYLEEVFAALGDEKVSALIESFEGFAAAARSIAERGEDAV